MIITFLTNMTQRRPCLSYVSASLTLSSDDKGELILGHRWRRGAQLFESPNFESSNGYHPLHYDER